MSIWQKWKEKIHKWLFQDQPEHKEPDEESHEVSDSCALSLPKCLPYEVVERYSDSRFWSWTERIRGSQACLTQEKFIPEIECEDEEIVRYFQSATPSSCEVLLHYLSPTKKSTSHPVLLVHGAGHHANLAWCESPQQEKGLVFSLTSSGRDIFAVTFAHPHGDNWQQAIQLANVIQRIKEVVPTEKIDLVAHSKGGIPAWLYLSGLCSSMDAPYQGEVERYFMLGTPNRGLDFPFRHVLPNWSVVELGINAPIACDSMLYYGRYIDTTERSIYGGSAFPGSSQLLYRWDDRYPIKSQVKTLYSGGQNVFLHSRGIDAAIRDGGDLMKTLLGSPIDPDIEIHILAGNNAYFQGVKGEQDGDSDGLVFVESVLFTDGIASDPKQVKQKEVLPLNHLELLYHPDAHQWVFNQQLKKTTQNGPFSLGTFSC